MTAPVGTLSRWNLSDDRLHLTAEWVEPEGIRIVRLSWPRPATDEEVALALTPRDWRPMSVGERRYARRWALGRRTLWLHVSGGPPTWWTPRVFRHEGALVFGWLRRAYAVAVKPTKGTP